MANKSNKREHPLTLNSVKLRQESFFAQMSLREALISLRLTGSFNLTLPMILMIISTEWAEQVVAPMVVVALCFSYWSTSSDSYGSCAKRK